jgi:hypothetical protein
LVLLWPTYFGACLFTPCMIMHKTMQHDFTCFVCLAKNIYIFLFYCPAPISNPKPLNKEQGYPPSRWFFRTLQIIVLVFIYLKIKVKPIKACDRTTQLDTCGLYMFKCLHFSNPKLSTAPRVTMRNSQEHFFGYNFEWL